MSKGRTALCAVLPGESVKLKNVLQLHLAHIHMHTNTHMLTHNNTTQHEVEIQLASPACCALVDSVLTGAECCQYAPY